MKLHRVLSAASLLLLIASTALYSIKCEQIQSANSKLITTYAPHDQLPMVVLICSYNNAPWVDQNLDSVFAQEYDNFRILYIDDYSQDGTASCVQAYKKMYDSEDKLTLIENTDRCRKMKNMYNAVHSCKDEEIIVQLDGDDWFCDKELLARINLIYKTSDVWLTYGSYIDVPGDILGYAKPTAPEIIENQSYRKEPWIYMPTRTFYAWLFKAIRLQDFIGEQVKDHQGLFFPSADDPAFMFPMLEMAGDHFAFVDQVSYVANRDNPLIGRTAEPSLQGACGCDIRFRKSYQRLTNEQPQQVPQTTAVDVLIWSPNNAIACAQALNSIIAHTSHLQRLFVVYESTADEAYGALKERYDTIKFFSMQELSQCLEQLSTDYILVAQDTVRLNKTINIDTNIKHLLKTGAYGFYFAYGAQELPFHDHHGNTSVILTQHIYDDVHAWKFNCGRYALFNNYDMTLMKTTDFLSKCQHITKKNNSSSLSYFLKTWLKSTAIDLHAVGLCASTGILSSSVTPITTVIDLPPFFDPPPGRGYRTPLDLERKRLRKERLQERWQTQTSEEVAKKRRLKKRGYN